MRTRRLGAILLLASFGFALSAAAQMGIPGMMPPTNDIDSPTGSGAPSASSINGASGNGGLGLGGGGMVGGLMNRPRVFHPHLPSLSKPATDEATMRAYRDMRSKQDQQQLIDNADSTLKAMHDVLGDDSLSLPIGSAGEGK